MAKGLIGTAWQKFYADNDPNVEDIVPQQVVHALFRQLGSLKAQYEEGADMLSEAEAAFAAIRAGAKRFRVSPT